jgi:hypothetical protein
MEPPSPTLEFVAEPAAPAPAAESVRPKRVEPATAGLPMLDIEMPEPTRPMRAPTPMPAPISWPSMHTRARTESVTPKVTEPELPRVPEPVAPKPLEPEMAAPSPEPTATVAPAPAPAPAPAVEDAECVLPTPAPIAIDATPATAVMSPMPWLAPEADTALDMPPAVTDFRESTAALELAVPTELATAGVAAHSSPTTRPSRWPMYVGALAVLAVMAFLGLRARPQTETLEPKPMVASVPAATAPAIDAGTPQASARPQSTPIGPAGPSNAVPEPKLEPLERDIVPAAPELIDVAPANVGSIDVQIDPNGASRQQALEETRRQIESQMQR